MYFFFSIIGVKVIKVIHSYIIIYKVIFTKNLYDKLYSDTGENG